MRRVAIALAAGALIASAYACSSALQPQCDCADPSLRVSVPPESAAGVTEVRASGTACDGVPVTCAQQGIGGCASWRFAAAAAGTCHVEVLFASGKTYARDVTIQHTDGCCSGFYASPVSAADIEVTPPANSAADGGAEDAGEDASGNASDAGDASDAPADG